jgi:hypothetical protein
MFLGLLDPDPDPSIMKQIKNSKKNLEAEKLVKKKVFCGSLDGE